MEGLEQRIALSTTWTGGGDGRSWADPKNWNTDVVPGSGIDAVINVGGDPHVTLPSGATSVHSVTVTGDTLVLGPGSSLSTTTGLSFSGSATFEFDGGSVSGGVGFSNSTLADSSAAGAADFGFSGDDTVNGPITTMQTVALASGNITFAVNSSNAGAIALTPSGNQSAVLTIAAGWTLSIPGRSR